MSVWIEVNDRKPPLDEDVLILYKHKEDKLIEENLFYGIAHLIKMNLFGTKEYDWSHFTDYQGFYEVCYWTPLVDMPRIDCARDNE